MIHRDDDKVRTLDQDTLDMSEYGRLDEMAFHVGDILVYRDGTRSQIIGFEEVKMDTRDGGHEWVAMLAVETPINSDEHEPGKGRWLPGSIAVSLGNARGGYTHIVRDGEEVRWDK